MVKTIYLIQHTKKNRSRKTGDKDGKALYKINEQCSIRNNNEKLEK